MSQQPPTNPNWKSQTFMYGGVIGALFGIVAAYLYTRAAEDDAQRNGGKPNRASTGELIGLGLAALAMIRQITEMAKADKKR
jgi:hypothetical protein